MPHEANEPVIDAQRDPRMKFSVMWFIQAHEGRRKSPRESTEQLWNRLLLPMQPRPKRILELGLAEGRSTMWLLQNLKPDLWVGVDPWFPDRRYHKEQFDMWKANFFHNIRTLAEANGVGLVTRDGNKNSIQIGTSHCTQVCRSSQEYLLGEIDKDFPGQPFDMAYVDAAHGALEAMADMIHAWRKLIPGGLMLIDDFDRRWHNARPHCHEAIKAFWTIVEHNAHKLAITDATTGYENKRQVWIRKRCN